MPGDCTSRGRGGVRPDVVITSRRQGGGGGGGEEEEEELEFGGGGVGSVRDQRDEKYVLWAMGSTICAGL